MASDIKAPQFNSLNPTGRESGSKNQYNCTFSSGLKPSRIESILWEPISDKLALLHPLCYAFSPSTEKHWDFRGLPWILTCQLISTVSNVVIITANRLTSSMHSRLMPCHSRRPEGNVRAFLYSADGRRYAIAAANEWGSSVHIWTEKHDSLLLYGGFHFRVQVFDAEDGKLLVQLDLPNVIELAFSPKGTWISTWERYGLWSRLRYCGSSTLTYLFAHLHVF